MDSYEKNSPDVIFLDIEIPTLSGIDFLKKVRKGNQIFVMTTSHPEFALEGYELNVFDYLLKPLDENRFYSTIRRIEELVSLREKAESFDILFNQENIYIKEGHTHVKIHLNVFMTYRIILLKEKK